MALFDCTINEKCCSVDRGRGICPLFASPPRGIWQLKSPHPREFAIQGKKNANARGSVWEGGARRRWNWLMHYIKDVQDSSNKFWRRRWNWLMHYIKDVQHSSIGAGGIDWCITSKMSKIARTNSEATSGHSDTTLKHPSALQILYTGPAQGEGLGGTESASSLQLKRWSNPPPPSTWKSVQQTLLLHAPLK